MIYVCYTETIFVSRRLISVQLQLKEGGRLRRAVPGEVIYTAVCCRIRLCPFNAVVHWIYSKNVITITNIVQGY